MVPEVKIIEQQLPGIYKASGMQLFYLWNTLLSRSVSCTIAHTNYLNVHLQNLVWLFQPWLVHILRNYYPLILSVNSILRAPIDQFPAFRLQEFLFQDM